MAFLLVSRWIFFGAGDHSKMFLLFEFCCGTPPSCLKVMGGGGGGWPTAFKCQPKDPWFFSFGGLGLGARA